MTSFFKNKAVQLNKSYLRHNNANTHRRSQTEASLPQRNTINIKPLEFQIKQKQLSKILTNNIRPQTQRFYNKKSRGNFSLNLNLSSLLCDYATRDFGQKKMSKLRKIAMLQSNKTQKNKSLREGSRRMSSLTKELKTSRVFRNQNKKQSLISHSNKSSFIGLKQRHRFKQSENNLMGRKQQSFQINNNKIELQIWQLQITKICQSIEQLRKMNLQDKKINKWCLDYFDSKKKGLIDVFMKKIYLKKSLNDQFTYVTLDNDKIIWNNVMQAGTAMTQKQRYFLGIQISMYRNFLEQKIAYKHKIQLNHIQNHMKINMEKTHLFQFAKQLYSFPNAHVQVNNFYGDLQRVEKLYGKLNIVSVKNRKKFQDINESQINIKKKMIESREIKIIKHEKIIQVP